MESIRKSFYHALYFIVLSISQNSVSADLPSWIQNQSRMHIDDKISLWGTGMAQSAEIAIFKAQNMAIRATANECGGFVSKGIKIEKNHLQERDGKFVAYARTTIPFAECDYNKTPLAKNNKDLENTSLKKGLALYDAYVEQNFKISNGKGNKDSLDKIEIEIQKHMDEFRKEYEIRLTVLERDVENLKNKPSRVTIINKEVHLHGNAARYEECEAELTEMQKESMEESNKRVLELKSHRYKTYERSRSNSWKLQQKIEMKAKQCTQLKKDIENT